MNWDKYFLEICNIVAQKSNCYSRKVGAVIVKDNSIISTGYNGPPRGVPHCNDRFVADENIASKLKNFNFDKNQCPRRVLGYKSGKGLEFCIAGHAERNAIVNAARLGIVIKDAIMYMNCAVPCKDCLIEIINAGIREIVVIDEKSFYDKESKFLLASSGINIREYCE